ncbi:uracil-DNA glycosylase [Candidatus Bathyarchaeota archaeon]|nr:MAG: uracil-DNA glycosylase [Candidatus Bathyarchaeota archaeon]
MGCTKCELHKSRKNAVPGEGPIDAEIMFVGEGPGLNEDEQGRPFVGAAGKFLTELLGSIGLSRSDVFITNIVKCRPPNNRAPRKPEIEACNQYLMSQIRLVKPRIVCALGSPAITTLLGQEYSATKVHGKPTSKGDVTILPMYHPAAALYDASLKEVLALDFKTLKELLEVKATLDKPAEDDNHSEERATLEKWV